MVQVFLYPSAPPSAFGYFEVKFSYDQSQLGDLINMRETELEGDATSPALSIERNYFVPATDDIDAAAKRLLPVIISSGQGSCYWVDLIERLGDEGISHRRIHAGFENALSLNNVYRTDWRSYSRDTLDLFSDMAEAAVGMRPSMAGF